MAETDDARPLASRSQVAKFLGLPSPGTLAQWAHRGIGPEYIRVGRHARYRWSEVERWLDERTVRADGGDAA